MLYFFVGVGVAWYMVFFNLKPMSNRAVVVHSTCRVHYQPVALLLRPCVGTTPMQGKGGQVAAGAQGENCARRYVPYGVWGCRGVGRKGWGVCQCVNVGMCVSGGVRGAW